MTSPLAEVHAFSDALVDAVAKLRPMQATNYGVHGYNHLWDDLSPQGAETVARTLVQWRDRAVALQAGTDAWAKLAKHVMLDWLTMEISELEAHEYERDLNNVVSPFQMLRMTFDSMDVASEAGAADVAARLESLPRALEGYQASLVQGTRTGRVASIRQARAVIEQGKVHAGPESYFASLPAQVGTQISTAVRQRIESGCIVARQAFGDFSTWLEREYVQHATVTDGVGLERYRRAVRRWVGADVDFKETYLWGWSEVARIHREMERVAQQIEVGATPARASEILRTDPARCAPDVESFLTLMRERQAHALAVTDFEMPEAIRTLQVRAAPPGGPIGAYYMPPSEDFSRPGTVFYGLEGAGPFPLYDEVSTAYHEGFPGHHLQCGLQVSLTQNLCRLHRVAYGYSGYAEGWALYAERLMGELGHYEKPDYVFGLLTNQLIRACRVVFDIGAHVGFDIPSDAIFGAGDVWSFERGIRMLQELAGLTKAHAESEITRYYGWPGQAISYKVGERYILALRDAFTATFPHLSHKEFHRRVLGCGNIDFDLLKTLVLSETAFA